MVPTFFLRNVFLPGNFLEVSWGHFGGSWAAFGSSRLDLTVRKQENQLYDQLYGRLWPHARKIDQIVKLIAIHKEKIFILF